MILQSVTALCVAAVMSSVPRSLAQRRVPTIVPHQTSPCHQAAQLTTCQDTFFRATQFVTPTDVEAFCKVRAVYSQCLETAICTCQYPNNHPVLLQIYKMIMRNNYEFTQEDCTAFNTGYTPQPGIRCTHPSRQDSPDGFRISIDTAKEPLAASLIHNCTAIQSCFNKRDSAFTAAIYDKDLSAFCRSQESFLHCLETEACQCGIHGAQPMLEVDSFEKREYSGECNIVTGSRMIIPEIACGDSCSLSNPELKCQQQFETNVSRSAGDEAFCSHLASFADCLEKLTCDCGLYQERSLYTALSVATYTFEISSRCARFPAVVFPSRNDGDVLCPEDNSVSEEEKLFTLAGGKEEFALSEDEICPGVVNCFLAFDQYGSAALYSRNLTAVCSAMAAEIQCLETTTCRCGTLHTRFSDVLKLKRLDLSSACGDDGDVIQPLPVLNCVDSLSMCGNRTPLEVCGNLLTRQAHGDQNPHRVECENYRAHEACIQDISCRCGLVKNGSSTTAAEIYRLLHSDAATYDRLGCVPLTGTLSTSPGITCPADRERAEETEMKLRLDWSLSDEKVELVSACPAVRSCYDQEDKLNSESLYTRDYKQVCRNQLQALKCEEDALCSCQLFNDSTRAVEFQERIVAHNAECSKFAPHGNLPTCQGMNVCNKTRYEDMCLARWSNSSDTDTKCNYANYLFCLHNLACTCGLVTNGTQKSAELVYRNVSRTLYQMYKLQCNFSDIPESLLRTGFECFDLVTAKPEQTEPVQLNYAQGQEFQQWSAKCPAVVDCAEEYDQIMSEALNAKYYAGICSASSILIQCVRQSICECDLTSASQVVEFDSWLVSIHGDCESLIGLGSSECGHIGEGGGPQDTETPASFDIKDQPSQVSDTAGGIHLNTPREISVDKYSNNSDGQTSGNSEYSDVRQGEPMSNVSREAKNGAVKEGAVSWLLVLLMGFLATLRTVGLERLTMI